MAKLANKIVVDQSVFPRKNGKYIDWEKCMGLYVPFVCNDSIHGKLHIIDFDKDDHNKFIVEFNGMKKSLNKHLIKYGEFIDLVINAELKQLYKLGEIVEIKKYPYKLKIVNYGVQTKNGKESIIYTCICPKCDHIFKKEQYQFKEHGCPNCFLEENNITKTAPWMIPYFPGGYEEARNYTKSSTHSIFPICPDCGKQGNKPIKISSLYLKGMSCSCSSKISYPEKYMSSLLEQLDIKYLFQPTAKFLGFDNESLRKYDFYIPDKSTIIETNGIQHYENIRNWKDADQQKEIDEEKMLMAITNGIANYIVIDCRYSNQNYIKKNIINSKLPKLLNFTEKDIDWNKCGHNDGNDRIKTICKDYHDNYLTINELCKKYNLAPTTINKYLNIGADSGWCIHSGTINTTKTPIEIIKDKKHIRFFKSMNEVQSFSEDLLGEKIWINKLKNAVNNGKTYKGFTYKIVEDIPLRWKILTDEII